MNTFIGKACLALRYLYYVEATSLVDDKFYDLIERVALSKGDTNLDKVGSDNPESYNVRTVQLAQYFKEIGGEKVKQSIIKNEHLEMFLDF